MRTQLNHEKSPSRTSGKTMFSAILLTVLIPFLILYGNWLLVDFFRDTSLNPIFLTLIAVVWGSIGFFAIYAGLNWMISSYPVRLKKTIQPWVFVGPALLLLIWLLLAPAIRTLWLSFHDPQGEVLVGLENYITIFTDRSMLLSITNTLLWVLFGATSCVVLGLLVAILADRSSFERTAKAIIFMPIAISFVGAGVIWKFIYAYRPPGEEQIGLLNAIVQFFGGEPQAWTTLFQPWNTFFLIIILIWMQTGFAMVLFSAAIKGVPEEIMEAARIDGASEVRIFFSIIIPYIKNTIIAVTTTIVIFTLKIFDIVMVMTGGKYGTEVIATKFYKEYFLYHNTGTGSALAILLLIAVIPVILMNVFSVKKEEGF